MSITVQQATIAADAALLAVQAAIAHGRSLGARMVAAVVDPSGNLVAYLREPGSFLPSTGIAQDKAYTAAGFGLPSAALYGLVKDNPALREGIAQRDRVVMFAGGFPIMADGRLLGGIGVSGGSEEQDCECALAALTAIGATS